jgi:exosome complex component RRP45
MLRGKEPVLSTCDRQFILEAIKEKKRLDGRSVYDYRHVTISPSHTSPGNVLVSIGNTKVQAIVTCQVVKPRPQRPTNGVLQFRVVLSPMASPSFELNRMTWLGVKIERLLEKCIRDTRAVDTESLCIIADNKV